jgi:anti-sigma-K factor RskA
VREYQEATTALPKSLPPAAPSAGLKDRVLAAATGQARSRPALLTRVFWSAAAVFLLMLMISNLFRETEYRNSVSIKGTEHAPAAKGEVLWTEKSVRLEITGLPALPAGRVYQVWQIGPEAAPIGGRTFTLTSNGSLEGADHLKYALAKGQTIALTDEPLGGSRGPTGKIRCVAVIN